MNREHLRLHAVHTDLAPRPAGHYAQAIKHGDTLYISGQLPIDPKTDQLVSGGIEAQAICALTNLAAILAAAGSNLQCVVKATVYLADINDWGALDSAFAKVFGAYRPARTVVPAGHLHGGALVEVDAVAVIL
jgi:2-iminobutanoate/2-iminopropanoate deaminase